MKTAADVFDRLHAEQENSEQKKKPVAIDSVADNLLRMAVSRWKFRSMSEAAGDFIRLGYVQMEDEEARRIDNSEL